ncbi:hypothetical protein B0T25DRAFT_223308 [Lasiosphaeria hispida]|uniref:Uncharacterized protein n=1 Tax=Lasiosphaeria hispida TaxID=260671 RepID=A0AAJ0MEZ2_9PEZI|nr:hypothetical protein B0T25DRAFT_223308 [Lasiosphaeria hispida]
MPGDVTQEGAQVPQHGYDAVPINLGRVSLDELRFWAAILAPGQGWRATMEIDGDKLSSPWAIISQHVPQFHFYPKQLSHHLPSIGLRSFQRPSAFSIDFVHVTTSRTKVMLHCLL